MEKATWEDVPSLLSAILAELRKGQRPEQVSERPAPEPVTQAAEDTGTVADPEAFKENFFARLVELSRSKPNLRGQTKDVIRQFAPTSGKLEDIPPSKLAEALSSIEALYA